MSEQTQFPESRRLIFEVPSPELSGEVLQFYERNRAHLEPWEPTREPGFYTEAYHRLLLEAHRREFLRAAGVRFWLRHKETGLLVGALNLNQIHREPFLSCTLGYKTDAAHVGQGLMTEAVGQIVPFVFGPMRLHRIEANVIPGNAASRRVLEKNGFNLEGYSPSYLRINGRWADHERYARISDLTAGNNPD